MLTEIVRCIGCAVFGLSLCLLAFLPESVRQLYPYAYLLVFACGFASMWLFFTKMRRKPNNVQLAFFPCCFYLRCQSAPARSIEQGRLR